MQKTILKQQYKNFAASRSEGLDKTYDRFQKLISQLEIYGEVISQEDANLKLLRSLPPAWDTHTLIMRNKSDLDTLSMDDLYNNLKVYEAEIKGQSSSSSNSQNVAFISLDNTSSTNEAVNIAHNVSAASSQGQASASTYVDDGMFFFFANQSNSPQLDNKDSEQIDTDDLEEVDLKWQMAMLTMRVKRFIKKTKRNLNFNGKETVGFERQRLNVTAATRYVIFLENAGHQEFRGIEMETIQEGLYQWRLLLMPCSDTEVHTCSKKCLQSYQTLQKQYDKQRESLNKANLEIISYQLGLESLEARIVVHQKNEAIFEEDVAFLKYIVKVRDNSIIELKNQLKESLKEKDDLKLKLENFKTSSKSLTNLINSQISPKDKTGLGYDSQLNEKDLNDIHMNKSNVFESASDSSVNESEEDNNQVNDRYKAGEGYHAVPPPYTRNFMPPRLDLSFAGLDDSVFKSTMSESITSVYKTETSASKTSKESMDKPKTVRPNAPLIEDWESNSDDDCVIRPTIKQIKPSCAKINFVKSDENTRKCVIEQHTYKQAENLGKRKYVFKNEGKATGQREVRPVWNNAQRVNHQNFSNNLTHPHPKRNFVPTTVATKSRQVPVNTAKQSSPRAVASISTARPVNTDGNPQYTLQDQGIFDSGCSRHLTGNKSFFTNYQKIDGGFVAFRGSPKGGKISGKGKIRTGKLDFEDVYFVKELKFNLFSVLQMCDKKNSVLFTKTECLVLSPDFKLLDENQVLLKVHRQNNMRSFDLKNVVPSRGLTCLFAKATINESNLWHRRLGHINLKTMNKLVRENFVRGLPSKIFENDHICVVCQKGKHHKVSYGKVKLVSEASIRRHLKLEDSDSISTLPNTEFFEQLALMRASKGYTAVDILLFPTMLVQGPILQGEGSTVPVESHHTPSSALTTSQPPLLSPSRIPTRQETKVPQPSSPTHTHVADEATSIGMDVRYEGAATTVSSLDAGYGSGNINKTPSMPYDLPLPRVYTLRSDEGRMQQNELMDLVIKLTDRVLALETDLQQTKKVYSTAFTKLIMKVKKLEKIVKSNKAKRRAKIVVSDDEDAAEDSSKQGRKIDDIDQDPNISLVQHDAKVQGRHEQEIKFKTEDISTAEILVYIRRTASKDKEERQRIVRVHKEASSFNVEEWEDIQATIEADEELSLRIQAKERKKYSEPKKARLLVDLINKKETFCSTKS
uniref:Ribonuclease H-like domain-containing protein n=1 Tax=Tanacetum cinerariifolium TaxID=118510 RepID=A0A6L2KRM0_TANCI|nr:ribonuclease H-like domain-containing protein [Tanacetum cinerariifolium]